LLTALDVAVLRLGRVAVGSLLLGDLPKGRWPTGRMLRKASIE
jgi:16S rRNA U516 pseudouridylate synthase RsuA-like enzyme